MIYFVTNMFIYILVVVLNVKKNKAFEKYVYREASMKTLKYFFSNCQGPRGQRGPRGATGKPGAKVCLVTASNFLHFFFLFRYRLFFFLCL